MTYFQHRTTVILLAICLILPFCSGAQVTPVTVNLSAFGIHPDTGKDMSGKLAKAIETIGEKYGRSNVCLQFKPGQYNFYPDKASRCDYFISNHDQVAGKPVAFDLNGWNNLTVDGSGAEFIFHGRMMPVAVVNSSQCTLKNFSIDFDNPHISQARIVESGNDGITFRPEKWVKCRRDKKTARFISYGEGWEHTPSSAIAFEPDTRHIVYRTSDLWCKLDSVTEVTPGVYKAHKWIDSRLKPGTVLALRTGGRPTPGILLSGDTDTTIKNVKIHYAEGMGVLAQVCENVTLDHFEVCLRGDDDPRYFTTQADATHFSGCKGHIYSCNGLYEGMMDDAINIHGTYLKVTARENDRTLVGRYMHPQAYGFKWGEPGDTVQFLATRRMDITGPQNTISSISPVDTPTVDGAKEFRITFTNPLPEEIEPEGSFGMENLTWSPTALFENNIVRNNRARGSLFSTPRRTEVKNNLFDHTSGAAILLCGDCNGWFETGACRDVTITGNRFINSLTNMFQFTEAVISIYPVIPELDAQTTYFHGGDNAPGIVITDNIFNTFDLPLLYAKSVNGLRFSSNSVTYNNDFPTFHSNSYTFRLQRVKNVIIENNAYSDPSRTSTRID